MARPSPALAALLTCIAAFALLILVSVPVYASPPTGLTHESLVAAGAGSAATFAVDVPASEQPLLDRLAIYYEANAGSETLPRRGHGAAA